MTAEIGARVRAYRERSGISQKTLADTLGLSPDKVSKIEAGTRRLVGAELAVAAQALGVRIDDILYAKPEPMHRNPSDTGASAAAKAKFEQWVENVRTLRDLTALR